MKRTSILDSNLLQSITQVFSPSVPTATSQSAPAVEVETKEATTTTTFEPLLTLRQEFQQPTPTRKRSSNFLKGCKWSPDGLCLLTNSDDNQLRLFEIPCDRLPLEDDLTAILHMKEPELIYDFEWYPYMDSSRSETCFIFSTCRDNPVHLFDAYTGQVRASYKALNHLEEVVAAYSLGFDLQSGRLYCGYERAIRAFDIQRPGPCVEQWNICDRQKDVFQSGIISCLSFNPQISGMYAAGSYAKTVGIYGDAHGELMALLHGHVGGLTHLRFSTDGHRLYSGARKDGMILCWDIRNLGELLCTYYRHVNTNQRIYFDFDPSFTTLYTGNSNGHILGWKLDDSSAEPLPTIDFLAHEDCANGISVHPKRNFIATSSGQRRFAGDVTLTLSEEEDDENLAAEFNVKKIPRENGVKIWSIQ